jgi:hypothetical protein
VALGFGLWALVSGPWALGSGLWALGLVLSAWAFALCSIQYYNVYVNPSSNPLPMPIPPPICTLATTMLAYSALPYLKPKIPKENSVSAVCEARSHYNE